MIHSTWFKFYWENVRYTFVHFEYTSPGFVIPCGQGSRMLELSFGTKFVRCLIRLQELAFVIVPVDCHSLNKSIKCNTWCVFSSPYTPFHRCRLSRVWSLWKIVPQRIFVASDNSGQTFIMFFILVVLVTGQQCISFFFHHKRGGEDLGKLQLCPLAF